MGTEQQFCLRWNNHQSTLVAVFDTLLESGTLVDCTLAAEGQYLKAHKVVLSACSPYFELLLSQHYEKHPIVILKDVKFQELKAMMDYMYRGEVNISQDQLGALLKAAESLQIKGLSDSGGGGTERETSEKRHDRRKEAPPPPPPRTPPILPHSSGLTIEHRRPVQQSAPPPVVDLPEDSPPPPRVSGSREGSVSPVPRKRKRHRRRSSGGDDSAPILSMTESRETSSSCELPPQSSQTTAPSNPAAILPVVPVPSLKPAAEQQVALGQEEQTESEILNRPLPPSQPNVSSPQTMPHEPEPAPAPKVEPPSELLEPKAEYLDDANNEDSVEDLTLDDDMDEMDKAQPGPSHGGEGSSSQGGGFAPWHVAADRSTDEVFMAAQEAVGAHRDSQAGWNSFEDFGNTSHDFLATDIPEIYKRSNAGDVNDLHASMAQIIQVTGFATAQDSDNEHFCSKCGKKNSSKFMLYRHIKYECGRLPAFQCPHCPYRAKQKAHLSEHVYLKHINPGKHSKPHVCSACGKSYKVRKSLLFHLRHECGVEPAYKCHLCDFQTKRKESMTTHMVAIHSLSKL
ncbi:longitudinals lacking protein, isoforms H/M/V isoform X2 [Anabrus simplex]|uniref:longitudinals lacking protein, isoforms H/M/V isoform X2 n=1 Tax=Anabrus simplex TaxID=316456 RepID=UPI0035A36873